MVIVGKWMNYEAKRWLYGLGKLLFWLSGFVWEGGVSKVLDFLLVIVW